MSLLRHVVLLKFKDDTPQETVDSLCQSFEQLKTKIDLIVDLEWGTDVSVENVARGYTHCFLVTFRSESDRDDYLPHPEHRAFGDLLRPHKEGVLVFDFLVPG